MAKRTVDIQLAAKATGVNVTKNQINSLAKDAQGKLSKAAQTASRSWTEFFFKWKVLVNGATAVWNTFRSALDSSFKFETMTNNFRFLLKDIDTARVHMAELKRLGDTPPFSLDEFAKASKQMLVMSDGVLGFSNSLKMVGDAAAAVGVPVETMAHAVGRLYAFIRDGQPLGLATRELRNMGVITPEVAAKLEEMRKAGASNIEIWDELVKSFSKFDGAMKATEKTGEGLISAIGTKMTNIWRQFTDQLMGDVIPALEKTKDAIEALEKARVGEKVAGAAKSAVKESGFLGGLWRTLKQGKIPTPLNLAQGIMENNVSRLFSWGKEKVSGWLNRPMSQEEIAAQIAVQQKKANSPNATSAQRRAAQASVNRLSAALPSAPAEAQIAQAAAVSSAASGNGNPFPKGTARYDYFNRGWIDASGKATAKYYADKGIAAPESATPVKVRADNPFAAGSTQYNLYNRGMIDKNGQATQAYKDAAAAERMKAEERARLEAAMKQKQAAQDLAEAAKAAKKQAEDAVKAERDRLRKDLDSNTSAKNAATQRIAAAQSEFDRAFAAYRDPDKAASQIAEDRAYAADLKRLHKEANSYAGKWRIDELSRLMAAGDTQGVSDTLESWRRVKGFSPQIEAMVRASAAEQTKTTAEDELRKIETNTADLAAKLEELIAMKGA